MSTEYYKRIFNKVDLVALHFGHTVYPTYFISDFTMYPDAIEIRYETSQECYDRDYYKILRIPTSIIDYTVQDIISEIQTYLDDLERLNERFKKTDNTA